MAKSTFFVQSCPTCGRNLEIRVQYLGRGVVCQHCRAEFVAREVIANSPRVDETSPILARAERILAQIERAQREQEPFVAVR